MFELHGRTALVTGAGRHVGRRIAEVLAEAGAAVAVNDIDRGRAEETAEALIAAGGKAAAVPGDITDPETVAAIVRRTGELLGPVDILVNNAGIPAGGSKWGAQFGDTSPEDWSPLIQLNVMAVLHCTHAVLPHMRDQGYGRLIHIVSDSARAGMPGLAVYGAAKAAAAAFSRCLATEVGRAGITSNCVSLGTIPPAETPPEVLQKLARGYPAGRTGTPDDIAPTVLWLASQEASWVTGQTVSVNGGWLTT
ncbi:SDR family NAD(P)-dependent oxidoreductase [Yinghuangia sp. YIM S10712]|uniref:SDR family NAD(P)-dependent oxidoreductase n=1 Tax=Yinghuangia sp. YIM S10712 TaxID=3436930 RepID=UPI003F538D91